jgi:NitT/TauT family transport system permease protein
MRVSFLFLRPRLLHWVDLLVLLGLAGIVFGLARLAGQWAGELGPSVAIDLDHPWALPLYTFYSLCRGLFAYAVSLGFTLVYGYWAARDAVAERVLVPLLDILQSIPVLSFLPGVVLALIALFPTRNLGLELAAILLIFTGQVWNMTFSFYHSLRAIPPDLTEVARTYRYSWWQRFKWLELPFATIGLVWNSMMSMAGGWFFLMMIESFHLGNRDFRLPGVGSYMKAAVDEGRYGAMLWALAAMMFMIVALDQLLWRPVVVWAQKFRVEEGGQAPAASSWFLDWLRRSRLLRWLRQRWAARQRRPAQDRAAPQAIAPSVRWARPLSVLAFAGLVCLIVYGLYLLTGLLRAVTLSEWQATGVAAGWTLGRVLLSTLLGTLWAVPAGLAIGLSPRLAHLLQPVVQVLASFPAPMLFPLVIAVLSWAGIPLDWGSVVLMLLGTQWYILFNVVAGATAIPADLQEAARSYRIGGWRRWWVLYLPAIFPYLVTGWVTAAGGAWNASIVSEYVTFRGEVLVAEGLGARISVATDQANFPLLAASSVVMALVVVLLNRTLWHSLYQLAQTRFSLSK